jgi:hypothetical protein
LTGIVKGSASYYVSNKALTITTDTVKMEDYIGSILINYRKNSNDIYSSVISLMFNYQADIYDRTIGSASYGKRPDFIWVNSGESANLSGSPRFGYYKWKTLKDISFVGEYTDSIRTFSKGIYILRANDGDGYWTNDTISILEKPILNNSTKTLDFPSTTDGVTYKLLNASNINGTDTIWTETHSFIGDGNAKSITLSDGKYKLTTTLGIHTAVYSYGNFVVGITTAFDEVKEEKMTYRLIDNHLQFDNEVNLKFYSLQGQLLQLQKGSSFNLVRQTGIFTATDKNGKTLTTKILLK